MNQDLKNKLKPEHEMERTWRKRIDELESEAERLALSGQLTVEEKLSMLRAKHREAKSRLESAGDKAAEGWDETKQQLNALWTDIAATSQALRRELFDKREDGSGEQAKSTPQKAASSS